LVEEVFHLRGTIAIDMPQSWNLRSKDIPVIRHSIELARQHECAGSAQDNLGPASDSAPQGTQCAEKIALV
jgi:hypothetical protein